MRLMQLVQILPGEGPNDYTTRPLMLNPSFILFAFTTEEGPSRAKSTIELASEAGNIYVMEDLKQVCHKFRLATKADGED